MSIRWKARTGSTTRGTQRNPPDKARGLLDRVSFSPALTSPVLAALFLVLLCFIICQPALAHSAAQMGLAPDQYDKGIPVYWPYHAALMSTGLVLFATGVIVMHYRKTKNWYRSHQTLQTTGGLFIIGALVISVSMVQLSGAPHLRYVHGMLGATTILLIVATLFLGYSIVKVPGVKKSSRRLHRFMGVASVGLVLLNIALGISMMTMVLAQ